MGEQQSDSESGTLSYTSNSSSDSEEERKKRKTKKRRKRSSSSSSASDTESDAYRKNRQKRGRKRSREDKTEKKRKRKKSKRHDTRRKSKDTEDTEETAYKDDHPLKRDSQRPLQARLSSRQQQRSLILQSAELAQARLESGDIHKARAEQVQLQNMYGTIDWRARKKLRLEKKKLERTIAAGKKLARMEEEENARMDAFRVALGLPTAEAQRQAEWREEATRALALSQVEEVVCKTPPKKCGKKAVIGPQLPRP